MNINIFFVILLLSSFLFSCKTETNSFQNDAFQSKISYIKFTLHHSRRIPNNKVSIDAKTRGNTIQMTIKTESANNDEKWISYNVDTSLVISRKSYEQLVKNAQELNHLELTNQLLNDFGEDGERCTIEIGNYQNSIAYKIWSPDYNTEERKLTKFLVLCTNMVQLAGLEIDDVFYLYH